jgi:hypothetical protein
VKYQNITLKIQADLLRQAKIVAAEGGTSLSALLTKKLGELAGEDAEYEAARRFAFRKLDRGWHLGRGPSVRGGRS